MDGFISSLKNCVAERTMCCGKDTEYKVSELGTK